MNPKINEIIEDSKAYVFHKIELTKLQLAEKTACLIADIFSNLVVVYIGVFFIFFLSIGIAFYIGQLLHNTSLGFIILSGFYLLLFLIFLATKKTLLKKPLTDYTIRKIFENED